MVGIPLGTSAGNTREKGVMPSVPPRCHQDSVSPPTFLAFISISIDRRQVREKGGTKEDKLKEQKRMVAGPQEEGGHGCDEVALGFLAT